MAGSARQSGHPLRETRSATAENPAALAGATVFCELERKAFSESGRPSLLRPLPNPTPPCEPVVLRDSLLRTTGRIPNTNPQQKLRLRWLWPAASAAVHP